MENKRIYEVDYGYDIVLLIENDAETIIGGSAKTLNKALKNGTVNLSVKDLDIISRSQPLGTLATDVYRISPNTEKIQEAADRLYANLIDKNTNNKRIAETLGTLDYIYKVEKNSAVRLLAVTLTRWYAAATNLYMNGRHGLPLKQSDRALLGEQFRADTDKLFTDLFTTLKKKKSPQEAEISNIIRFSTAEMEQFLISYKQNMKQRKFFCVKCRQCGEYFISPAANAVYCDECKVQRKKNSKAVYREKCEDDIFAKRQRLKYQFENFIHKNKAWDSYSDEFKAEYQALRKEFVKKSAEFLKRYEKESTAEVKKLTLGYIQHIDRMRAELEGKMGV